MFLVCSITDIFTASAATTARIMEFGIELIKIFNRNGAVGVFVSPNTYPILAPGTIGFVWRNKTSDQRPCIFLSSIFLNFKPILFLSNRSKRGEDLKYLAMRKVEDVETNAPITAATLPSKAPKTAPASNANGEHGNNKIAKIV